MESPSAMGCEMVYQSPRTPTLSPIYLGNNPFRRPRKLRTFDYDVEPEEPENEGPKTEVPAPVPVPETQQPSYEDMTKPPSNAGFGVFSPQDENHDDDDGDLQIEFPAGQALVANHDFLSVFPPRRFSDFALQVDNSDDDDSDNNEGKNKGSWDRITGTNEIKSDSSIVQELLKQWTRLSDETIYQSLPPVSAVFPPV